MLQSAVRHREQNPMPRETANARAPSVNVIGVAPKRRANAKHVQKRRASVRHVLIAHAVTAANPLRRARVNAGMMRDVATVGPMQAASGAGRTKRKAAVRAARAKAEVSRRVAKEANRALRQKQSRTGPLALGRGGRSKTKTREDLLTRFLLPLRNRVPMRRGSWAGAFRTTTRGIYA